MKLLHESEVPHHERLIFFRASRLHALFGLLICTLAFASGLWFLWQGLWEAGWYEIVRIIVIGIAVGFFFFLVFSSMWRNWIASFRPDNWVMIIAPDAVYAKFRSHLNHHLDAESLTVARFAFDDIVKVGKHVDELRIPSRDGTMTQRQHFLELTLTDSIDLGTLSEAITAERRRSAPSERVIPGVTSSYKAQHYPVTVLSERHAVRIEWRGERMLRELARHGVPIAPPHDSHLCRTGDSLEALETQILDLLERGMTLSAIRVARRAYGYSHAEAKQFIDGLGTTPPPTSLPASEADSGE